MCTRAVNNFALQCIDSLSSAPESRCPQDTGEHFWLCQVHSAKLAGQWGSTDIYLTSWGSQCWRWSGFSQGLSPCTLCFRVLLRWLWCSLWPFLFHLFLLSWWLCVDCTRPFTILCLLLFFFSLLLWQHTCKRTGWAPGEDGFSL